MRTLVEKENKNKKSFIKDYPFLALQKLIGFIVGLSVVAALFYLTQGDVNTITKVMMYPDLNLALFSTSVALFGYVVFVILRESWLMKTEVGLTLDKDQFIFESFDWNTYEVSFSEVKTIIISKLSEMSEGGWFKAVLHNGSEYTVYLSDVDEVDKSLPPKLSKLVQRDHKSILTAFAGLFFATSVLFLFYQFNDFYFFEIVFYGGVVFLIYAIILFKKTFSRKKILRRQFEVGLLFVIPAFMINFVASWPLSEIDRLFYSQIQFIQSPVHMANLEQKIELCEHVRENYTSLKPTMLAELERVCSLHILSDSTVSPENLERAFNWAYAQYVKKQEAHQVISLACMYAETNQKDFAIQLARKHSMPDLARDFIKGEKCRPHQQRGLASVR